MGFKFEYRGKIFSIDVERCESIFQKARGLMFRKKSKPLLFVFKKAKRRVIHSFFCRKFFAIWIKEEKVIDAKLVNPWKFLVKPRGKFDKLLEILESSECFSCFVDGHRNI